jgi:hypothetical protein
MTKTVFAALAAMIAMSAVSTIPAKAVSLGFSALDQVQTVDRRKPRVPGGSGCDDPRDLIEHPECRPK